MFQGLEKDLRATGTIQDRGFAQIVSVLRMLRGEDLPDQNTQLFSKKAYEQLKELGYTVVRLTGQSIGTLKATGCPFRTMMDRIYPDLEASPSRLGEVAILPHFFLPESDCKTLGEQHAVVDSFSQRLSREVKGVEAVIGEATDYAAVAFAYFKNTGKYLFSFNWMSTVTTVGSDNVCVSGFNAGLNIHLLPHDYRCFGLWCVPLVVPLMKRK